MSNCNCVKLNKGWNLVSLAFYHLNFETLKKDKRILEIKNMIDSYNTFVPEEFNTLYDILPSEGYFIKASESFELECLDTKINLENLNDGQLIVLKEKISIELNKRSKKELVPSVPIEDNQIVEEFEIDKIEPIDTEDLLKVTGKDYIKDEWNNIPEDIQEKWKKLGWNQQLWDNFKDPYNKNANSLYHDLDKTNQKLIEGLGFTNDEWDKIVNHEIACKVTMSNINFEKFNYTNIYPEGTLKEWYNEKRLLKYGRYSNIVAEELLEICEFNLKEIPLYHKIKNLNGIQFLKSLKRVIIFNSMIEEIDLTENLELEFLSCSNSYISELNLSKNKQLMELYSFNCKNLKFIDLRDINIKKIKTMNCVDCPNLKFIYVDNIDDVPDSWEKDSHVQYVTGKISKIECPVVDVRPIDEKTYLWKDDIFGPFYGVHDDEEYYISIFNDKITENVRKQRFEDFVDEQIRLSKEINLCYEESIEGQPLDELCELGSTTQEEFFKYLYSNELKPFVSKDFFERGQMNSFRTKNNNILSYDQVVNLALLKYPLSSLNMNFYSMSHCDIFSEEFISLPKNYKLLFTREESYTNIVNHKLIGTTVFRDISQEEIYDTINNVEEVIIDFTSNDVASYKLNDQIIRFSNLDNITFLTNLKFMNPLIIPNILDRSVVHIKKWEKEKLEFRVPIPLYGEEKLQENKIFLFTRKIN